MENATIVVLTEVGDKDLKFDRDPDFAFLSALYPVSQLSSA